MSQPMTLGLYRHHKGPLYVALGVATNSTNGTGHYERMVLYFSLGRRTLHVREEQQFHEAVASGVPRFRRVWP